MTFTSILQYITVVLEIKFCPAPCQVDSGKNKNILFIYQKQSVQFVQAALLLAVTGNHLLE